MKKLIYTSEYREKLIRLRNDLDLKYGKEIRQKVFSEIDHRIQQLKMHHYLGISVREKYGVNCDYYYIYVAHNLVFYQVDESCIKIINMYHEREDYIIKFLGSLTKLQ